MVAIYRAHAPAYADLTRTLTATDRLIDALVYQLYGLTEEETAIVVEHVKPRATAPAASLVFSF